MYFEIAENGKIMICAAEKIKPEMVWLQPPDAFVPDEMHRWLVLDGEFVDSGYVDPILPSTQEERIAQLEEELKAAKILLGLEV